MSEGGIFDTIGELFNGPKPAPQNSMPSTSSINSGVPKAPNTQSVPPPRNALNTFRNRQAPVATNNSTKSNPPATNGAALQSGGKRKMRSKSKSLRSLLFLKYKYKMARRSTMRKGRKGSRKASRKGSRRARR